MEVVMKKYIHAFLLGCNIIAASSTVCMQQMKRFLCCWQQNRVQPIAPEVVAEQAFEPRPDIYLATSGEVDRRTSSHGSELLESGDHVKGVEEVKHVVEAQESTISRRKRLVSLIIQTDLPVTDELPVLSEEQLYKQAKESILEIDTFNFKKDPDLISLQQAQLFLFTFDIAYTFKNSIYKDDLVKTCETVLKAMPVKNRYCMLVNSLDAINLYLGRTVEKSHINRLGVWLWCIGYMYNTLLATDPEFTSFLQGVDDSGCNNSKRFKLFMEWYEKLRSRINLKLHRYH